MADGVARVGESSEAVEGEKEEGGMKRKMEAGRSDEGLEGIDGCAAAKHAKMDETVPVKANGGCTLDGAIERAVKQAAQRSAAVCCVCEEKINDLKGVVNGWEDGFKKLQALVDSARKEMESLKQKPAQTRTVEVQCNILNAKPMVHMGFAGNHLQNGTDRDNEIKSAKVGDPLFGSCRGTEERVKEWVRTIPDRNTATEGDDDDSDIVCLSDEEVSSHAVGKERGEEGDPAWAPALPQAIRRDGSKLQELAGVQPQLTLINEGKSTGKVHVTWNIAGDCPEKRQLKVFEIFWYRSAGEAKWTKIHSIPAKALPMSLAVSMPKDASPIRYFFAVRAELEDRRIGPFSEPKNVLH